eukprot:04062.XXX_57558_57739_1 [CDS] Oithona nana genome sequencing.
MQVIANENRIAEMLFFEARNSKSKMYQKIRIFSLVFISCNKSFPLQLVVNSSFQA